MIGRYLHLTNSGKYRFRMRIPVMLQSEIGKIEVRQSLHTDSKEEALALAAGLSGHYKLEFLRMKKQKRTKSHASSECLSVGLITFQLPSGGEFRVDYGDDDSKEMQVATELYEKFSATDAAHGKAPERPSGAARGSPLISECIASYLSEQRLRGLRDKSISDYESALSDFMELHGDAPVASVSRESIISVAQRYAALPSNRKKKLRYRNLALTEMTLEELLDSDMIPKEDQMSDANVSKFIIRVNQLFNWIVTAGHRTTSPAKGLPKPKSSARMREPFSDEELRLIFESDDYRDKQFTHPYQYWIPLIALFTGARINEICQLRPQDVVTIDEILCFRITGGAGRIKNAASDRAVPVHSKLVKLGLVAFVKQQKGKAQLFPELPTGRDGNGQVASKWFKRYRDKIGVSASTKTFHSFRHTVATRLSYAKCQDYEIGDILGHKQQSVTTGTYRKTFPVTELAITIEKLHFEILWPQFNRIKTDGATVAK